MHFANPLRVLTLSLTLAVGVPAAAQPPHYHAKGKMPSKYTVELQQMLHTKVLDDLRSVLVKFNPNFQLMPGTVAGVGASVVPSESFEQPEPIGQP